MAFVSQAIRDVEEDKALPKRGRINLHDTMKAQMVSSNTITARAGGKAVTN